MSSQHLSPTNPIGNEFPMLPHTTFHNMKLIDAGGTYAQQSLSNRDVQHFMQDKLPLSALVEDSR